MAAVIRNGRTIARIDGPLGRAKVHKDWLPQALMGFLHRHEREERGHATPLYYFHTDAMGTPRLATDAAQQVVWRWNEDAFGATVSAEQDRHGHRDRDRDHGSHDIEVNLRYPGQYFDAETGLFYNWNRYYNPNTGRYSRSDPIGLSGGVNTFGYVSANPFSVVDSNGLQGIGDFFPADAPIMVAGKAFAADIAYIQGVITGDKTLCDTVVNDLEANKSSNLDALVMLATSGRGRDISQNGLPRPKGVPDDWNVKPSKKNGGKQYTNPNNPHDRVRAMPGNPNSPNPAQQSPYVKRQIDGRYYDQNGNPVPGDSADAHIPFDDFTF